MADLSDIQKRLKDSSSFRRRSALTEVAKLAAGDERARESFLNFERDIDYSLRRHHIYLLLAVEGEDADKCIMSYLDDEDDYVVKDAIDALGKRQCQAASEKISELVQSSSFSIAHSSKRALEKIQQASAAVKEEIQQASAAVKEEIQQTSSHEHIQSGAVHAELNEVSQLDEQAVNPSLQEPLSIENAPIPKVTEKTAGAEPLVIEQVKPAAVYQSQKSSDNKAVKGRSVSRDITSRSGSRDITGKSASREIGSKGRLSRNINSTESDLTSTPQSSSVFKIVFVLLFLVLIGLFLILLK